MKNRVIIFLVAALAVVLVMNRCGKDTVVPTPPDVLKPGETAKIIVKGKTIKTIKRDKTKTEFIPKEATIVVDEHGRARVDVDRFGLTKEPGLGMSFAGDKLKLTADIKWVYYRRWGLHTGASFVVHRPKFNDFVRPVAFVSFTPPIGSQNLSFWAGTEFLPRKYAAGIRWAF